MMRLILTLGLTLAAGPALADRLVLPAAVERAGTLEGSYVVDPPRAGGGTLALEWTDTLGRVVARTAQPAEGQVIPIRLDASRAAATLNRVRARLDRGGAVSMAEGSFVARPRTNGWDDFRVIMYQDQEGPALAGLRALGISALRILGHRTAFTQADVAQRIAPALGADLRWYVENIATDFYSAYHRWTPEHPREPNWLFLQAQTRHLQDPADPSVFLRTPSLSDPEWIARIQARLRDHVQAHGAYRPLYYSLGDEPGIADLAANWDFDRSPPALSAFRAWLRESYGTLEALNAAWGSDFKAWDAVMPEATTAAMARKDDNFAAWNDHKAFMDASFAAALRAGTEALHAADPSALSGIEGGQVPGWGGWDYGLLAPAMDLMEIYDAGQNVEIARSQNPELITLATVFGSGIEARRSIWRSVMKGAAGLILWDEEGGVIRPDGTPGPRGLSEGKLFRELTDGLGALMMEAQPPQHAVAVLYSPPSFRVQWMLDHRAQGDGWTGLASSERDGGEDNAVRGAMRRVSGALAELGVMPHWITHDQLADGILEQRQIRVLLLPRALVLSDADAAAIGRFAASGGAVIAEGETGSFDGLARRRPTPALPPGLARPLAPGAIAAALAATGLSVPLALPASLTAPGTPSVALRRSGAVLLLGIVAPQPGAAEHDIPAPPGLARDLRGDSDWRPVEGGKVRIHLDEDGVGLIAFAPSRPPRPQLAVQPSVRAGETALIQVRMPEGGSPVLHVELRDPAGRIAFAYTGNALMSDSNGQPWLVPFALNDPPGNWTVTARDPLGGEQVSATVSVLPPP